MLRMLIAGIFYWLWLVCPSAGLAFTLPSGGRLHSRILKKEPLSVPATLLWKPRSSTLLRLGGEVEFKARSDNVDKKQRISAFVESMGGKRTIQRILVASNGMAATKAILSMREWAYKTFGKLCITLFPSLSFC